MPPDQPAFLRKRCPVIVAFIAATGGAIRVALTYAPTGGSRLAAVLVSAAAAVGLSRKGLGATLGKALFQAEPPSGPASLLVMNGPSQIEDAAARYRSGAMGQLAALPQK